MNLPAVQGYNDFTNFMTGALRHAWYAATGQPEKAKEVLLATRAREHGEYLSTDEGPRRAGSVRPPAQAGALPWVMAAIIAGYFVISRRKR